MSLSLGADLHEEPRKESFDFILSRLPPLVNQKTGFITFMWCVCVRVCAPVLPQQYPRSDGAQIIAVETPEVWSFPTHHRAVDWNI